MSDTRQSAVPLTPHPHPHKQPQPHLNRARFEFECLRRRLNTGTERAKALGISTAQLSKILRGERHPGAQFIHGCMALFTDCDYEDLFTGTADAPHGADR